MLRMLKAFDQIGKNDWKKSNQTKTYFSKQMTKKHEYLFFFFFYWCTCLTYAYEITDSAARSNPAHKHCPHSCILHYIFI